MKLSSGTKRAPECAATSRNRLSIICCRLSSLQGNAGVSLFGSISVASSDVTDCLFFAGKRLPGLHECQRQMSARQLSEPQIGVVEVGVRRRPENDYIGAATRRFGYVGL